MLELYTETRAIRILWEALFLIFFIWSWKHLYLGWKEFWDDKDLIK